MELILSGAFENAMIRAFDAVVMPGRNMQSSGYYGALNRYCGEKHFDRAAAFVALGERILVPTVDWNMPYGDNYGPFTARQFGIVPADTEELFCMDGPEGDVRKNITCFVDILLTTRALSETSWARISTLDWRGYDQTVANEIRANGPDRYLGEHYLKQLLGQILCSQKTGASLVLSSHDIHLLSEIAELVTASRIPIPFDLPDLSSDIINEDWCLPILNFSCPDIEAVAAVKADTGVRTYAKHLSDILRGGSGFDGEQRMIEAMVQAHIKSHAGRKATKLFEIGSWLIKPLSYLPKSPEALGMIGDVKDIVAKWLERTVDRNEWHLIGIKMSDIALKDYLERKGNLVRRYIPPRD